jgi:hypothetical protein
VEQSTLAYLATLTDAEMKRIVIVHDAPEERYTVDGLLWHVMIHEMRHTAQIAVLLRTQGIEPPWLDPEELAAVCLIMSRCFSARLARVFKNSAKKEAPESEVAFGASGVSKVWPVCYELLSIRGPLFWGNCVHCCVVLQVRITRAVDGRRNGELLVCRCGSKGNRDCSYAAVQAPQSLQSSDVAGDSVERV